MAKWRDSYQRGQRVEVLTMGSWEPATVVRKTETGTPIVQTRSGLLAIDRKTDIRPRAEG